MNGQIVALVATPFIVAGVYFAFFEDVGVDFFRSAPKEFAYEVIQIFFPQDQITNERSESSDFLTSLSDSKSDAASTVSTLIEGDTEKKATYQVTFVGSWSRETHSNFYPENAHFSPFVIWGHSSDHRLFEKDIVATPGIEKMAELGGTITLEKELSDRIGETVYGYSIGDRFDAPGESTVEITIDEFYSYISLVSMIAPSPDWFLAIEKYNMIDENGDFIQYLELPLAAYDAGTENGNLFNPENPDTIPQEKISELTDIPSAELESFGKIIFNKR